MGDFKYITLSSQAERSEDFVERLVGRGREQPMNALTRDSKVGDRVFWETVDGKRHEGTLREWDSNVAIISVQENATPVAVEC